MDTIYWPRRLEGVLSDIEKTFPAIVITGPRQSGKSTLLNRFLKDRNPSVVNLDDPNFRALLSDDP